MHANATTALADSPRSSGGAKIRFAWLRRPRRASKVEARQLADHVLAKVGEQEDRKAFVELRFRAPLEKFGDRAYAQAIVYSALNLLTAAGGLATAAIATAGNDPEQSKTAVAVIGLFVGVAAVFNQLRRPGERNAVYSRTAHGLRTEGWEYVLELGEYKGDEPDAAYGRFAARVLVAPRDAELIAEPGTSQPLSGQKTPA
jgi:hypothetical protein